MMRETKNMSGLFAHMMSSLFMAVILLATGCAAGLSTTGPEVVESADQTLSMTPNPADQDLMEEDSSVIPAMPESYQEFDQPVLKTEPSNPEDPLDKAYSESASVNRIEFSGLPAGKSVLTVGTTRPVRYEIREVSDKKVIVQLMDTRIPENQKRPLITNRFESAVDRVVPIQTGSMKDSLLTVELREKVGYQAEQKGSVLQIRFDASSISPKPLEEPMPPYVAAMTAQTREDSFIPERAFSAEESGSAGKRAIMSQPEMNQPLSLSELFEPPTEYTGEKIALDFFETDIRNVFRILREVSGKNFAIDRDVTGTVTMTLEQPLPWDQILDLILKMNQLGKVEQVNVIRIARVATIKDEQEELKEKFEEEIRRQKKEERAEPLVTEFFAINYSDALRDVLPKLCEIATAVIEEKDRLELGNECRPSDGPLKRIRGSISVDRRTNMVIMVDTEAKIQHAREIVQRLDAVTPQVIIEARVVEVTSTFSREIGIQWGLDNASSSSTLGGIWGFDTAVNLPVSNPSGTLGFDFSRITGSPLLIDARLSAAESQGKGRIISSPKVMTLSNKEAVIRQGREVPYTIIDKDGVATTEFKEVDLRLEVTPHVTPDDRVTLKVIVTKDEVLEFTIDGIPIISTKRAQTELLVNDGETIVIGGILLSSEAEQKDSVPGLGNVPVLSWLFKKDLEVSRKEELLIFLTPRIMRLDQKDVVSYQN